MHAPNIDCVPAVRIVFKVVYKVLEIIEYLTYGSPRSAIEPMLDNYASSIFKNVADGGEILCAPIVRPSGCHSSCSARQRAYFRNSSMALLPLYFMRLYFFSAATTRSPGKPNTRIPSAPVIVCAASIALTTASSVASIVA